MFDFLRSDSQVLIFSCPRQIFFSSCSLVLLPHRRVCSHSTAAVSSPLHTHDPATVAPCQTHSEASGFPAGDARTRWWHLKYRRLNCFVCVGVSGVGWGEPCISIKWASQAKHIPSLAAMESEPAASRVSQRELYLAYLLNVVRKKIK